MSFLNYGNDAAWRHQHADQYYRPQHQTLRAILRRWFAVIILSVMVAIGSWIGLEHYQNYLAGQAALSAAKDYILELTDIDHTTIDAKFAKIAAGSTGEFYDQHSRMAAKLRGHFVDHKVQAHGHIVDAVVKSSDRDHAVILLLVNQAIRNTENPISTLDRSRVRMDMRKVNGHWLASKVELV